jgi:hypothetical protein
MLPRSQAVELSSWILATSQIVIERGGQHSVVCWRTAEHLLTQQGDLELELPCPF